MTQLPLCEEWTSVSHSVVLLDNMKQQRWLGLGLGFSNNGINRSKHVLDVTYSHHSKPCDPRGHFDDICSSCPAMYVRRY